MAGEKDNFTSSFISPSSTPSPHLLSEGGYYISAAILFFITITGFINNLAVMIVMAANKHLRTPLNTLLLNLSCSDMGISLVGAPVSMAAALQHGWKFNRGVCVGYAFLMSLFGISSISTLTVLSIERCLMITKPFKNQEFTAKRAQILILIVWLYSVFVTAPPLIGWGHYGMEGPEISCSVDWETKNSMDSTYIFFLFIFGLGIPVVLMGASYVRIMYTLKKHTATTTTTTTTITTAERRVAIMVLIMVISFLIAWSPYAIISLVVAFGGAALISPSLSAAPAIFAKTSCIYNPVIYVGLNTQFRSAWLKLLQCDRSGRSHPPATTEKISLTQISDKNEMKKNLAADNLAPKKMLVKNRPKEEEEEEEEEEDFKEGKNHLAIPMKNFKDSSNSVCTSECTSVSEMV